MKLFAIAIVLILTGEDIQAQQFDRPNLPPGMKFDTIRRKDPNNWEFMQIKMPGGVGSNQVIAEGSTHNGVLESTWIEYWENSTPRYISFYSNGKKTGISVLTDPTGGIVKLESYREGLLEGPTRVYEPHAGMITEETYYSEGQRHGKHTKWYANHNIQEEGNYIRGKLEGVALWYYDDGKKSVEYTYHEGILEGNATVYFKSGIASDMGPYVNNVQSGDWKEFYENGNLKEEGNYVNGEKEGVWKQYDEQGKFTKTVKYKKGELKK